MKLLTSDWLADRSLRLTPGVRKNIHGLPQNVGITTFLPLTFICFDLCFDLCTMLAALLGVAIIYD